jgi:ABC-type maltose transport system permease subunit
MNIPNELDEAARVDGCTHFGAFWRVIMPVMWPGVITTGLFSFLLGTHERLGAASPIYKLACAPELLELVVARWRALPTEAAV